MAGISKPGAGRSSPDEFEGAIKRAVRVLKGSTTLTPKNVSRRAVSYLNRVNKEYLEGYIKSLPEEKRLEFGIEEG